ncbi:unknown [Roseburia sp. CAG:309]|nr:unknown [Roseburia sp. CAG:309]
MFHTSSSRIFTIFFIAVLIIHQRFQQNRIPKFQCFLCGTCQRILFCLNGCFLNIQFFDLCFFLVVTLLLGSVRNEVVIFCAFCNLYIFQTGSLLFPTIRRLHIDRLIRSIVLFHTEMKFGIFTIQEICCQSILIICFCIRISGSGFIIRIVSFCIFVIFFLVFCLTFSKFCLGVRFRIGIHINIRCRSGRKETITRSFSTTITSLFKDHGACKSCC